ncbi:HlyD family secretion protein [Piscinibacter sakaiensis]|uniref:HlyD family efflux transporter periplasmic adaptor subunit n=1 Tax=Piscinibacter sakaiensis TaxID=1547922 RepID=UPI00372933D9
MQAPYDGIVADVAVVLGDMAMPGRPLLTVYDPSRLRVSAPLPESAAAADGRPLLRPVRLGPADLAAGERVALDPQAAARIR